MAVFSEGNGVTYTFSGIALDIKNVELPGYERQEIDVTNLDNATHTTSVLAALVTTSDFLLTAAFDAAEYVNLRTATNGPFKIIFPGGANITFYAQPKSVGNVTLNNAELPVFPITFKVTNLNGTVETAPAYSAV